MKAQAHLLRVAQRGWDGPANAKSIEETHAGIEVAWIEIDGHRLDNVTKVEVVMDEHFTTPVVTLVARVEIVYVDKDGKPLPLRRRIRARRAAKKAGTRKAPR